MRPLRRHPLTPVILITLLLTSGLPTATANHLGVPGVDVTIDSVRDAALGRVGDAVDTVADTRDEANRIVRETRDEANKTTDPTVVVLEENVENGGAEWEEEILPADEYPGVRGVWHATARDSQEGRHSFWWGLESEEHYSPGLDRALVSAPIDLRGMIGTDAATEATRDSYQTAHDGGDDGATPAGGAPGAGAAWDAAAGAYGDRGETGGRLSGDAPVTNRTNVTAGIARVDLRFNHLYDLSFITNAEGLYHDGARVEVRAQRPDGGWRDADWRPLYPTIAHENSVALSENPYQSPFSTKPAGIATVQTPVETAASNVGVGGDDRPGAFCGGIQGTSDLVTTSNGDRCSVSVPLPRVGLTDDVSLDDPYGSLSTHPEDAAWLADPREYRGHALRIGWAYVGVSDVDGDDAADWIPATFNLTDYAGEVIQVRFRGASSPLLHSTGAGWFVDNVTVKGSAWHDDVGVSEIPHLRSVERVPPGVEIPLEGVVKNYGRKNQTGVVAVATAESGPTVAIYEEMVEVGDLVSQEGRNVAFPTLRIGDDTPPFNLTVRAALNHSVSQPDRVSVKEARKTARVDENPDNDAAPFPVRVIPGTVHNVTIVNVSALPRQSFVDETKNITVHVVNAGNVDERVTVEVSARRIDRETGDQLSWHSISSRRSTMPPGQHLTSLGVPDANRTFVFQWLPPSEGIYDILVNVTSSGAFKQERIPSFVKASPATFMTEGWEVLDVPTANRDLRGAEATWQAAKIPWRPYPYDGKTVWSPDLKDGYPETDMVKGGVDWPGGDNPPGSGTLLRGAWRTIQGLWEIPWTFVDSLRNAVTEAQTVEESTEATKDNYYLARKVDLTQYAEMKGAVTFRFHHASTMNHVSIGGSEGGDDPNNRVQEDQANLVRGHVLVYDPDDAHASADGTPLQGDRVGNEYAGVTFNDEALPLMAAQAESVATFDSPFPWSEGTVDLTAHKGEEVVVLFHYEIPPGRARTQTTSNQKSGTYQDPAGTISTTTPDAVSIPEWADRWLVDGFRVEVSGIQVERDNVESANGDAWRSAGWARTQFSNPQSALWHLQMDAGKPVDDAERFRRALWWGVLTSDPFCNGYRNNVYSVAYSPPIHLTQAIDPVLRFDHRYTFDDSDTSYMEIGGENHYFDGGNVRVRVLQDDGTWGHAMLAGGDNTYPGKLFDRANEELFGSNMPGFVGTSDVDDDGIGDWTGAIVDLSQFAGKTVRVEFHAISRLDETSSVVNPIQSTCDQGAGEGWFIDNLRLQERRFATDLAVDALAAPSPPEADKWYMGPGSSTRVSVTLRNTGMFPHLDAGVQVRAFAMKNGEVNRTAPVYNHTAIMPETNRLTGEPMRLEPNGTVTLSLPPWSTPDEAGTTYQVEVTSFLLSDGERVPDENPLNDVRRHEITLLPIHDVALSNLTITPRLGGTEPRHISAQVENLGNMDERFLDALAKFQVAITVRDDQGQITELAPKSIGELAAGNVWTPTTPWTWTPEKPVLYTVEARLAVPQDQNLDNNEVATPVIVYAEALGDDMEGDDSLLTGEAPWRIDRGDANSGERAWAFTGTHGYPNDVNASLSTLGGDPLQLQAARTAFLAFHHDHELEEGYDAGLVEACVTACAEAGAQWHALQPERPYEKLTTASPLVESPSKWATDPDHGVAFTGRTDGWEREVIELGRHDFLTERLVVFNDTFTADVPLQERGVWTPWNYSAEPHSPGYMWYSTADYGHLSKATRLRSKMWENTLELRNVDLRGVTTDDNGRFAYLSFWDWRNLGTAGQGQYSSISVDIVAGDDEEGTIIRHEAYLNNYQEWTKHTIPIPLETFQDRDITIRFVHRISNPPSTVRSMNLGWAIDDVRIHALTTHGSSRVLYPTSGAVDALNYPGDSAAEATHNATNATAGGPHWNTTFTLVDQLNRRHTNAGSWVLTDRVGHPGWTSDVSANGVSWRFGGTEAAPGPGNRYSRLISPVDLSSVVDAATLILRHEYDLQSVNDRGEDVAVAGGAVQVALTKPDADGGGVEWLTLSPNEERMGDRTLKRLYRYTHSPFGDDPEADSPFGPPDRSSPQVFSGETDGEVVDHYDLSQFRGQKVWVAFTAWSSCPPARSVCSYGGDTDTQSWTIRGVAVEGEVLRAEDLHLRFRGVTDGNNPGAGWSVDDVQLLAASREYGLRVDVLDPAPGTRVPAGQNRTATLRVINTGIRAVEAQVAFSVVESAAHPEGVLALTGTNTSMEYQGTVSLAPGESRVITELDGAPLVWNSGPVKGHGATFNVTASTAFDGASRGVLERVISDNYRAVPVEVTRADRLRVTDVVASPNDVSMSPGGARIHVTATLENDSPHPHTITDATLHLRDESKANVAVLPMTFGEVSALDVPPYGRSTITWPLDLAAALPEGNYSLRVYAAHEGGGSNGTAYLHVADANETFFSRLGFHPPHERSMMVQNGTWTRDRDTHYNHTTYYHDDPADSRASWRVAGAANQYLLVTPWVNVSRMDLGWLTFRHRYLLPSAGSYSAGAVVELRNGTGDWSVITPEGGYGGTMTSMRPTDPPGIPRQDHNPLVWRLCGNKKCDRPGWVGNSKNYALPGDNGEGWEVATFNLSRYVNFTGDNADDRVQLRFAAGVPDLLTNEHDWAIDYITVSPHRILVGPEQSYAVEDGTDKTYRFTIQNVGQFTDAAEVRAGSGSLPDAWNLTVTLPDGTPLTDNRGAPVANVTLQPGESRDVRVRLQIPIKRTFDSERTISITTTSLKDPSRSSIEALQLDFQPRSWPDLSVAASDVRVAAQSVEAGQVVPVHVKLRNVGDTLARDVAVSALDVPEFGDVAPLMGTDGGDIPIIPFLAAGEETTITLQWTPMVDGNHTIRLALDPEGDITEYDEVNNVAARRVGVGAESLPDLRVTAELRHDDGTPVEGAISQGDVLVVRARIENRGTGPAAGVQVAVLADAFSLLPRLPYIVNGTIPPGGAVPVEARWRAEIPGDYLLHVEAFSDWTVAPERTGRRLTDGANYTDDNFWRAPLVVRSPGLTLSPVTPDSPVNGGDRIAMNLTVANRGNAHDAYRLTLTPPPGWSATFHESNSRHVVFNLPSGGNTTLIYFVEPPRDAAAGVHPLRITGVSHNSTEVRHATVPMEIDRVDDFTLEVAGVTTPPRPTALNLTLTNGGNGPTRVLLHADVPDGWRFETAEVNLTPFQERHTWASVHIPDDAAAGVYEVAVHATGDVNTSATTRVVVTPLREIALAPNLNGSVAVQRGVERVVDITLANRGNLPAQLDLSVDTTDRVEAWLEPAYVALEPAESVEATLHIRVQEVDGDAGVTITARYADDVAATRTLPLSEVNTDLTVGGLTWEPRFNIRAGTTMTFNTLLANAGGLTMDRVPIALFVDGHVLAYQEASGLKPNETRTVTFEWTAQQGEHDIWVIVDPYEEFGEQDESNNALVETLRVESGGPAFLRIFQDGGVDGARDVPGASLLALLVAIVVTATAARKVRRRD